jgi:hypothetical protein
MVKVIKKINDDEYFDTEEVQKTYVAYMCILPYYYKSER